MSRHIRNRVTALALGGFLLGTAFVTTGTAQAGQIQSGAHQVVFGGGGTLGRPCRSTPSVASLTIPAESTVRVVNRTGRRAKLLLNGKAQGTVADHAVTEVVFRRGITAVTLDPRCAITEKSTPVVVTTSPSASPSDGGDMPAPPEIPGDDEPSTPAGTDEPPTSEPEDPGTVPEPSQPQTPPVSTARPPTSRPVPPGSVVTTHSAAPAGPPGGNAAPPRTKTVHGTSGSTVSSYADVVLGNGQAAAAPVPGTDVPVATTEAAPAPQAGPTRRVAAAEPVAAMAPLPDSRPIGLLAVIAAVCVLGVGTGSIRAFVSQRASRTSVA
ncbi:hypothetical protein [Actinoplanes sp. N902-109]|uniref:hypothetical protein n=1 Tax=Actinoplanes sp. (strain N902-109) TaxID=649831 RepID=UPI000329565C|nr:hypothetical protein [Actinoplanes sp. N902-109]AGL21692.1 hypothetical protein L083_8182 [Actinoplanes sp. N902-109]